VINRHLTDLAIALQEVDAEVPRLQSWAGAAAPVLAAGGTLFVFGSDGDAAQAQYLAGELAHADDDRPALSAVALIADASGGAPAPADQFRARSRPGDLLLCLCASGASGDAVATATAAAAAGLTAWALTGPGPNRLADVCADAVRVRTAGASTVEEVHLAAVHIFLAAVDSAIRDASRAAPGRAPRSAARQAGRELRPFPSNARCVRGRTA
jgi:D-sedoheptulose 7-phosphate isomerase